MGREDGLPVLAEEIPREELRLVDPGCFIFRDGVPFFVSGVEVGVSWEVFDGKNSALVDVNNDQEVEGMGCN